MDGKKHLEETLRKAGYASVIEAIAEMTVFVHPDTVAQTENRNIFKIIRDPKNRGKIIQDPLSEGSVMADDNEGPANAFLWSIGEPEYKHVQFNHIYSDSKNSKIYTSLANLCLTPAFLSKLTDGDDETKKLLQYRVYEIFGFTPPGHTIPEKPNGYEKLKIKWRPFPDAVFDLEAAFRRRLQKKPKSRSAISARQLGWLFSDFQPDESI